MNLRIPLSALIPVICLATSGLDATQEVLESESQTMEALVGAARRITEAASAEIRSKETWEVHRGKRLEQMRDMLGLLPWPDRTPLNAQVTGSLDRGSYVVEKLVFESLPKIYVTANLYLPKKRPAPLPTVIYVCGHAYSPFGNKTKYQRHGISLAKNGYIALILDSIQIAETFGLHHGILNQEMPEWYARGYTPAGVEVWNAVRAIDYLETRPEVDAERIGMTGRSGGAAMTWFTASVDPRVKVAVPVMGISTYEANVAANTQQHHCDCMFVINSHCHDMLHQGALIAPRPLLMAHGKLDRLFPVPGYEDFEEKVGALYESYGRSDAFGNIVVETAHEDSDFLREQAIRWFDRHLKRGPERRLEMGYTDVPSEQLAVFRDGPPADAQNYRVHETFIQTPEFRRYDSLTDWKEHRANLVTQLRNGVFENYPSDPGPLDVQIQSKGERDYFSEVRFSSEPGIMIRGLLNHPEQEEGTEEALPGLLYVASDGEDGRAIQLMSRHARGERVVRFVVYPRGIGPTPWEKSKYKDVLRNAMHVGHTVDSLRLWDVLRAVEAFRAETTVDRKRITVAGSGVSGILALYAAVLDSDIYQVLLLGPPSSHVEGPFFLNVLRYLDIPEAAALMAPRRLNFYSRIPPAFERVSEIYGLYGCSDHLFLTMDINSILHGRYDHNFASGL